MNVVDSSGWLEYFGGGRNADRFAPALREAGTLIVPTLSIYEVFKCMHRSVGEVKALAGIAQMRRGAVVALDEQTALDAAALSLEHGLPMADSVMLATARGHGAILWTQDADFDGIPGVEYIPHH